MQKHGNIFTEIKVKRNEKQAEKEITFIGIRATYFAGFDRYFCNLSDDLRQDESRR